MTGPTVPQHRAMHALWRQAGVLDRADRLALTGAVVGRELASSNDLTAAEADQVIAYQWRLHDDGRLASTARTYLASLPGHDTETRRSA